MQCGGVSAQRAERPPERTLDGASNGDPPDFGRPSNDYVGRWPQNASMPAPVIGVTMSETLRTKTARQALRGEPAPEEMALALPYMRAVEMAGALPVALTPLQRRNVDSLLDHVSGLLLTGGPDIDPSFYGAEPHPKLGDTDRETDGFEIALCSQAFRRGIPVLGICRGAHVLNVARDGTLHQHVPNFVSDLVDHRDRDADCGRDGLTTHGVRVLPDSRLSRATGGGPVWVNSWHHQAIGRPGLDLRPVAWAVDGVIEAVESTAERFALGIQWHAELLVERPEHLALFEQLVEAASGSSAPADRSVPAAAESAEPSSPSDDASQGTQPAAAGKPARDGEQPSGELAEAQGPAPAEGSLAPDAASGEQTAGADGDAAVRNRRA